QTSWQCGISKSRGKSHRRNFLPSTSSAGGKLPHPSDFTRDECDQTEYLVGSYVPRKSGASVPLQNLPVGIPPKEFFPYGGKFARKIESAVRFLASFIVRRPLASVEDKK
ncbi:hypothetical protein AKJ16_DCAP03212, partial [Drosera capensis]